MMKTITLGQVLANKPMPRALCLLVIAILSLINLTQTAYADNRQHRSLQIRQTSNTDIYLTVSQYELALIQVLSEICPPMLNSTQRVNFSKAYNNQLRIFMPTSTNPQQSLKQLSGQKEYRLILQNVRSWTTSYPAAENRALCQEFAQMAH